MKSVFVCMMAIMLLFSSSGFCKIWTVDNNYANGYANFSNLSAANNAATDGDTVYVAGSPFGYDNNVNITHALVIIGPGYFLNENVGLNSNSNSAYVSKLFAQSDGIVIIGMNLGGIEIDRSRLFLERNYIGSVSVEQYNENHSVLNFQQNYIAGGVNLYCFRGYQVTNVVFSGNYIGGDIYENTDGSVSPGSQAFVFNNNVISGICHVYGETFNNNIFLNTATQIVVGGLNTYNNNICTGTQLPAANNNILSTDLTTVFIGTGSSKIKANTDGEKKINSTGTTDGKWQLKANSPASGKGVNGVDIGMFGGSTPYVLSGIPPIPMIYALNVATTGNNTTGIPVQLNIRTNH